MEFERALFRVHEGFVHIVMKRNPTPSDPARWQGYNILTIVERVALGVFVLMFISTILAHVQFQGRGDCIVAALHQQHNVSLPVLNVEDASRNSTASDKYRICSDDFFRVQVIADASPQGHSPGIQQGTSAELLRDQRAIEPGLGRASMQTDPASHGLNTVSMWGRPETFVFSPHRAILFTKDSKELRERHNVRTLNVTIPDSCLVNSAIAKLAMHAWFGWDDVVVNQAMYGFQGEGWLLNNQTKQYWNWNKRVIAETQENSHGVLGKLGLVWNISVVFLLNNCMAALVVRALNSSSIAIMFPLVSAIRALGLLGVNQRVLTVSYPWLGVPVDTLQRAGRSSIPFLMSHLLFGTVVYIVFEASQATLSYWFYPKSFPLELYMSMAGMMVGLECFTLLFARSRLTITYYPKFVALYFATLHLYIYSVPYGVFNMAVGTFGAGLVHLMLYFLRACEVEALCQGQITAETPRYFFNELSQPVPPHTLPPVTSIFYPTNTRIRSIYEPTNNTNVEDGETPTTDATDDPVPWINEPGTDDLVVHNDDSDSEPDSVAIDIGSRDVASSDRSVSRRR